MSVRFAYKVIPLAPNDARFPAGTAFGWIPILNVSIIHKHSQTKRFEAILDSGAPTCLFHASVGEAVGVRIEDGQEGKLGGVVRGADAIRKVYYHPIKVCLASDMISLVAGFSRDLSVLAILGRAGFFDNYVVTFDPSSQPPGLLMERIHRT